MREKEREREKVERGRPDAGQPPRGGPRSSVEVIERELRGSPSMTQGTLN